MDTYVSLPYRHEHDLPEGDGDSEVRMPESFVEHFLRAFTDPGDRVFDPFVGYGTVPRVAERLDRAGYGVEYEPERVASTRERTDDPDRVWQGDVRDVDLSWVPACDCCLTSPPFMRQTADHDPFQNYAGESTYAEYLDHLETTFERVAEVLAPGGHVLVDVVNLKHDGQVTPLAWDVADRVSNVFHFEGEVVVTWERPGAEPEDDRLGYGYDHSYCHVFRGPD